MVLLQRVPESVCENEDYLEAMLEQAGLEGTVARVEVLRKGRKAIGEVLVTLRSHAAAEGCVQIFTGCEWGAQGAAPVKARRISQEHALKLVQECAGSEEKSSTRSDADTSDDEIFSVTSDAGQSDSTADSRCRSGLRAAKRSDMAIKLAPA